MRFTRFVCLLALGITAIGTVSITDASQPKRMVDQATSAFTGTQRMARANIHGAVQASTRLNHATSRSMGQSFNRAVNNTSSNTATNTWRPTSVSNSSASLNRRTPTVSPDTSRQQREAVQRQQDTTRRQQVDAQQKSQREQQQRLVREQQDQQRKQQAKSHQEKLTQEKRRQDLLAKYDQTIPVQNRGFQGTSSNQTLKPGTAIDRYGRTGGDYVAPAGTPKAARSLNRSPERPVYNMYVVKKPIHNTVVGPAAAARGQAGGGTQIILPKNVQKHLDDKSIRVAKPKDTNFVKNNFNGNAQP